jgi:type II secretory pathway predicted ATPase ExeA
VYLEHFGLNEPPFRITPHTDFFFEGAGRGAALDALVYAILHEEGIVKVSGEVGSGKTMLCRVLIERLPAHVETIYLATPSLGRDEILHAIADELKLESPAQRARLVLRELQDRLIALYAEGRRVVVAIDEAHAMPEEALEQVRLLSNLESGRHKLLQIVLFGQPELGELLDQPSMRPLKDRITHSFEIRPLAAPEVGSYLSHRMRAAGYRGPDLFQRRAVALIARASQGLTRRINILADKALLAAYAEDAHAVAGRHVRAAIADSEFARPSRRPGTRLAAGLALAAGVFIGAAGYWWLGSREPARPVAEPSAEVPAPQPPAAREARSLLTAEQIRRIAAYPIGEQQLLRERVTATVARLETEPDERLGIELFFTSRSEPARVERFLARARAMNFVDDVYVVPVASAGRYRIRVFYSVSPTREAALAAEHRLPEKYRRRGGPLLRTFAELRSTI